MDLKNLLMDLAIESGEVQLPETSDSVDTSALVMSDEDFQYATEARFGEVTRALAFCDSFEAITERYSNVELSTESVADYHFAVGVLMSSTGVKAPVAAFTVSLEAAEADKKSFGQKAKDVVAAVLKWIREMIVKLKAWLTRSKDNAGVKTEAIKKKVDAAKETVKEVKALGYTAVPAKPKAAPAKAAEPAASTTPEKVTPPKEGVIERDTVKDGAKPRPTTPAHLLTSGKLNTNKIRKFLVDIQGLDYRALAQKAINEGAESETDVETFTVAWRSIFDDYMKPIGTAAVVEGGVVLDELNSLLDLVRQDAEFLFKMAQHGQEALGKLEKAERELKAKVDADPAEIAKDRKFLGKLLAVAREGQSFQNNLYTAVVTLSNQLSALANMAKTSVQ